MGAQGQASIMIGQTLGHYHILEQIGAGGMGVVYRAHDQRLDRDVALKVLPTGALADEIARHRFRKEALALSKLNHPNIATVHDFDTQDDVDFVVMEYIQGTTLADQLKKGPLPEKDVLKLGTQVTAALEEAHEHGVVHRDLKPGNIMVTPKAQAKVLDFGLARVLDRGSDLDLTASLEEMHPVAGSLPYMSPEQLRKEQIDARCDIWAAGAVLYEMCTGQRPFPETIAPRLIDAILNRSPRPPRQLNPRISPGLESIILKALEKEPTHRYQSAKELLVDHERLTASQPPTAAIPWQAPARRRRGLFLGAGLILLLLAGAWFGLRALRSRGPTPEHLSVLIGDFENRTGEPVFERTLHELLTVSLEQSHYVSVFPSSRQRDVLQRMGLPDTTPIDEKVGQEICQREGLQALLLGSISRMGNSYILLVRSLNPSGQSVATAQQVVPDAGQIPSALDVIVQNLRRGLGESSASVQKSSAPLAQVTSVSLDAVRYFTLGKQRLYGGDPGEAIVFFEKALELDPGFAMAHEYLGTAYTNINDPVRAEKHLHDATLLVDKVTEPEKLKILGDYNYITSNYDKAVEYYQILSQLRPQDPAPLINLGLCYAAKLDLDSALAATEKAVHLQAAPRPRVNLASLTLMKGNSAEALSIAQQVLHDLPGDMEALSIQGQANLLLGRLPEARRTFEAMVRAGGDKETQGRVALADLALATGRYHEARSQLEAGIVAAEKRGNRFAATKAGIELAGLLLDEGPSPQFYRAVSQIEQPTNDLPLALLLGMVYARGHSLAEAQKMLKSVEALEEKRQVPSLESFQYLLRAELALAQGNANAAVEAAEKAVRYENSTLALETLARCYAAAGRDDEAIRDYEQVIARAGERSNSYDSPGFHHVVEIHYRLGVLYQKTRQLDRSRSHLQTFLGFWSHPDTDLEIFKDAQERLRAATQAAAPARGTPTPAT
jgi:serine/threonine protein kinase/tetratricopeptide (TPR) repeat protein